MFQPDPHQNEKVLARELVEELPAGTLVVADLGYFGFAWFDWLTDRGYHCEQTESKDQLWLYIPSTIGETSSMASCGWEPTALIVPRPFGW